MVAVPISAAPVVITNSRSERGICSFSSFVNYQDSASSPDKRWGPVLANQGPECQSSHISLFSDEFKAVGPHFPFTEFLVNSQNPAFSPQLYHSTIEINFAKVSSRYPQICHTKNRGLETKSLLQNLSF